jgi:hypothetical protein
MQFSVKPRSNVKSSDKFLLQYYNQYSACGVPSHHLAKCKNTYISKLLLLSLEQKTPEKRVYTVAPKF